MTELASMGQLRGSLFRWALVLVPAVLLLGLLSGQIAGGGADNPWFIELNKPSLYPTPVVFSVVWTLLYIMMGLSVALVASARGARWRLAALAVFGLQLALNLAWSPLFFGGRQIFASLILLAALDAAVIATIALFWLVRPAAALLLLPCLAWTLFATLLTWQFHVANPNADGQEVSGAVTRIEI